MANIFYKATKLGKDQKTRPAPPFTKDLLYLHPVFTSGHQLQERGAERNVQPGSLFATHSTKTQSQ
jgi:hypothetical protein